MAGAVDEGDFDAVASGDQYALAGQFEVPLVMAAV